MDSNVESYDLRPAQANRQRLLATPRKMVLGGAVLISIIDVAVLASWGFVVSSPLLLAQMAISFTFVALLAWVYAVSWAPGPVRLELTADGMIFIFASGKRLFLRWNDPSLDVSVSDYTGIPWGKPGTPQPVPMYFTGVGAFRSFALTAEAGSAIVRAARVCELSVTPRGRWQSRIQATPPTPGQLKRA